VTVARLYRQARADANSAAAARNLPALPDDLVLYCARHTCATNMLEEMDVVRVKELLGHEDIKTTMKYLRPGTANAAEAVNRRNERRKPFLVKEAV